MPNFPSIYLELQELWKRIRNNDADLAIIKTEIDDLQAEDVVINTALTESNQILQDEIISLQEITSCITHKNTPYEVTIISCSLEQGKDNIADGNYSHAEGTASMATGDYSHAEGRTTYAVGTGSHAEGRLTHATGNYSHAEGGETRAVGNYSHAEGLLTTASAAYSHAEGLHTIASASYQHVQGIYNQTSSTALMIVGNGDPDNRSNVLIIEGDEFNHVQFYPTSSVNNEGYSFGLSIQKEGISTPSLQIIEEGEFSVNKLSITKNGIKFNINTDGSGISNDTLNDYEEGIWTPVASGFTTGSSNGYYTKIGNAVHITLYVNSCSLIQSEDYISGLPYSPTINRETPVNFAWRIFYTLTRDVINTGFITNAGNIYMPNITSKNDQFVASCTYLTS